MQTIPLGTSGRQTTRLGFGCSSLMGALGRKDSLAMLDAAYDAGLRHFDVAPSYGYGEAESCLGDFLSRHPGAVTVTTKFGVPPAPAGSFKSAARDLARPLLKLLPGLKSKLQRVQTPSNNASVERADFSVERAQASLDHSLKALRLDRLDVWLLHEVEVEDLRDEQLLRLLEDSVTAGKIGTFGVGSEQRKIALLETDRAAFCPVLQYEWSVLDPLIAPSESFRIHHRALTENFRALHEALASDTPRATRWSDHVGSDVSDPAVLARLMLKASLVCNPESIILFSSKHPRHIQSNVDVVDDQIAAEQALRLYSLVRAEAVPGLTPTTLEVTP